MKSHSCYLKIKLEVTTPRCTLVDLTLGIWFIPTPFLTPTPKPTSVENNAAGLCPQQINSPLSSSSQCPHLQGAVAAWSKGFLLVSGKKRLPSIIRVLFSLNGARLCKQAPLHRLGGWMPACVYIHAGNVSCSKQQWIMLIHFLCLNSANKLRERRRKK